ncbi:zinc-ribbon domain-containing protein [Bifidobacterium sp. CP2]|uniref:zinc ribbon domain-containing protein n=1 Tax=Bifidobacterium sp. CP2 TaxID=2809025 RepID=UPI001BDCC17D|nr:zinc ribbon domain-containing protein [Bifidobacterium sp. CP2]MBT1181771.1 zinc-ribbon domain-containing protein [Bifidobacterium sp. CP2]
MKYCAHCGQPIADGATFCGSCGAPAAGAEPSAGYRGQDASAPSAQPYGSYGQTASIPTQAATPADRQPTQAIPVMPQSAAAETQALPPLPGAAMSNAATQTMPPLPGAVSGAAATQTMPPLPGQPVQQAQPVQQGWTGQPGVPASDGNIAAGAYGVPAVESVPGGGVPLPESPAMPGAPVQGVPGNGVPGVPGPGVPGPGGVPLPGVPGVPGAGVPGVPVPGAPGAAPIPAPAPRKRGLGGGAIAGIIGGVVAVILVVALAFIIPNLTAVKMMLGFRPNNPLVVTYDALASIEDLQSTRYELAIDSGESGSKATFSGAYSLGKTTDESMLYVEAKMPDYMTVRGAWQHGNVGLYEKNEYMSGLDWYGDMDQDFYYYMSGEKLRSGLRSSLGREWSQVVLDTKDALVKNGKWDIAGAQKTFLEQSAKANGDESLDDYLDQMKRTQPTDDEAKDIAKFSMKFFGEELEKKDVDEAIFPTKKSERTSTGSTKLTYEFDIAEFVHRLAAYWQDHEDDYPGMRDYMIRVIKESNHSTTGEASKSLDDAIDQMLDVKRSEAPQIEVTLDYGEGRTLNELSLDLTQDRAHITADLKLTDKGKVSVDDEDVTDFMKDAKRENDASSSSSLF